MMNTACDTHYKCCIGDGVHNECSYRRKKTARWICENMNQIGDCEDPNAWPENQKIENDGSMYVS